MNELDCQPSQLTYDNQEYKWGNYSLVNKWCLENWTAAHKGRNWTTILRITKINK